MHDRKCLAIVAIERLLTAVSGRQPVGDISDVLKRIVLTSRFFSISSQSEDLSLANVERLVAALRSVVFSEGIYDAVGIDSTIPGVGTATTRIEFVRQYILDLFYESYASATSQQYVKEDIFEQKALCSVLLFLVSYEAGEWFSVCDVFGHLHDYSAVCSPYMPYDVVVSLLVHALCAVEALIGDSDSS